MERSVAHINIAYFQTAVAVVAAGCNSLTSYPIAVANNFADNSILIDISSQASLFGLKRGMKIVEAKRLCPDLKLIPPAYGASKQAENTIIKELSYFSPYIETAGAGHFFADITGTSRLNGSNLNLAKKVKDRIEGSLGLKSSVGLGANKLISKVATKILRPSGICAVEQGEETSFMAPLPISNLPGIDKKNIKVLRQLNFQNIKELQSVSVRLLSSVIDNAEKIIESAKGIDNSPIFNYLKPSPSIEECVSIEDPTNDDISIFYEIKKLVSKACLKLRSFGLAVEKMRLYFEYTDGRSQEKKEYFPIPVMGELTIFNFLINMFKSLKKRRIRISFIQVSFEQLSFPYGQVDLFQNTEKEENLFKALDTLKARFGDKIIDFKGLPSQMSGR